MVGWLRADLRAPAREAIQAIQDAWVQRGPLEALRLVEDFESDIDAFRRDLWDFGWNELFETEEDLEAAATHAGGAAARRTLELLAAQFPDQGMAIVDKLADTDELFTSYYPDRWTPQAPRFERIVLRARATVAPRVRPRARGAGRPAARRAVSRAAAGDPDSPSDEPPPALDARPDRRARGRRCVNLDDFSSR